MSLPACSFMIHPLDPLHLNTAPAWKQLGTTHGTMLVEGPVEVLALEMILQLEIAASLKKYTMQPFVHIDILH
jgi:hypothetical protein